MGRRCGDFSIVLAEWRTGVNGVWGNIRWTGLHGDRFIVGRDGFNVRRNLILADLPCKDPITQAAFSRDPVVGAQYRWTALYAPRFMSPEFWSLIQGWSTLQTNMLLGIDTL